MKTLLRTIGLAAVIGGFGVAVSREARAVTDSYVFQGVICNPDRTDADYIHYDELGATNAATSGASRKVTCGISLPNAHPQVGPPTVEHIKVRVYDRRSTQDVTCTANYLTTQDGSPNGANPGLITSSDSSEGNPAGSQELVLSTTPTAAYQLTVRCDIPAVGSGGSSYVTNIIVSVTQPPEPPGSLNVIYEKYVAAGVPCGHDYAKTKFMLCTPNSTCGPETAPIGGTSTCQILPAKCGYDCCRFSHTFSGLTAGNNKQGAALGPLPRWDYSAEVTIQAGTTVDAVVPLSHGNWGNPWCDPAPCMCQ
jgi:hypothetical protein